MSDHLAQIRRLFGAQPITERITMRAVTEIVVEKSGVKLRDILSDRRDEATLNPRHVAMYLCRHHTPRSYMQLGEFFRRDHGSVINGVQRIERVRHEDWIAGFIENCESEIAERWPPAAV